MGCEKRPYLCGILVLGSLALFFHVVGFVTPGWLILRRSVMEDESIFEIKGQLIDNGGVSIPQDDEPMFRKRRSDGPSEHRNKPGTHHGKQGPHHENSGPHHDKQGPHHEKPHNKPKEDFDEEKEMVEVWMMEATSEIKNFDVRTSYGLWYSTVCVHTKEKRDYDSHDSEEKREGDEDSHDSEEKHEGNKDSHDSEEKHEENDDWSSSSEDGDKRKRHCRCKKMSTKCALKYAFMYENNFFFKPESRSVLSYKNFGYASLTEHRVENCVVLAFLVFGLIAAIVGFRKVSGCRYAGAACVIFMMIAAFLSIVPVARLTHYSVVKTQHKSPINVHAPYSVIATGLGSLFALITAFVAGYGLIAKSRKGQTHGWYQFNNEELPSEKKEQPKTYVYADALPAKPGLYDVCDFSNIKPVEEVKKPEKEEEPDEFIL